MVLCLRKHRQRMEPLLSQKNKIVSLNPPKWQLLGWFWCRTIPKMAVLSCSLLFLYCSMLFLYIEHVRTKVTIPKWLVLPSTLRPSANPPANHPEKWERFTGAKHRARARVSPRCLTSARWTPVDFLPGAVAGPVAVRKNPRA